jgi:hypothetical protein
MLLLDGVVFVERAAGVIAAGLMVILVASSVDDGFGCFRILPGMLLLVLSFAKV